LPRKEKIKKAAKRREHAALKKLQEEQLKRIKDGKTKGFTDEYGNVYKEDNYSEEMENIKPQSTSYLTDFASAKGRLSRPASGQIITAYGNELSKGVSSKGIVIKTRPNAQIIAPYDGSVIFSGPFKGYGNLIIIDHGKGYVSLLAGMGESDIQTGQMLLAGEPVGIMPDSEAAKFYMENLRFEYFLLALRTIDSRPPNRSVPRITLRSDDSGFIIPTSVSAGIDSNPS
jgi:septal ring factor EnvC (AmiA/AmiB activator)